MIKGLLLYTPEDAAKNKWFIQHLIDISKAKGIELTFLQYTQNMFNGKDEYLKQFKFCINRTRYDCVNNFFESGNVRCYNNAKTVKTANDKWLTYLLCKDLGVPAMETAELNDPKDVPFKYPYVVKSRNGHGGSEVFWIDEKNTSENISFTNKSGYIAQKPVSASGIDVRVYVLGGKPVASVKRTSTEDFRSNFSLGGQVELFSPTDEQLAIIDKLQNFLATDYVGIDFMMHNGHWILNEIEDAVGSKMLYSLCNYDIAENFIDYIANDIR